jgi:hypothetical protein
MTKEKVVSKPNIEVGFEYERDTKRKVRYKEITDEGEAEAVGYLYISQLEYEALGKPKLLSVVISAA